MARRLVDAHLTKYYDLARTRHGIAEPGMSANSNLDRESFQQLLASAFAVQESRMDTQSLSAIIQIQHLIAGGGLDAGEAIHIIAEHAQNVAQASGVAVALLQGPQLVYRVGIGSAAAYVGRHMTATLSVAADTGASREILRVENAQNDARIEAAICRQFGAESLLIMPIYHSQKISGVLAVMFREAHSFQEREVRVYRMMAGLLGEALMCAAELEKKEAAQLSVGPPAAGIAMVPKETVADDYNSLVGSEHKHAIYQICEAAMAATGDLSAFWRLPGTAAIIGQRIKRLPFRTPQWSAAAAAVVALTMIGWSAYSGRHQGPRQRVSFVDQQVSESDKPSAEESAAQPEILQDAADAGRSSKSAFRRVRVGKSEIDYVADDVTIRYFTRPTTGAMRAYNQVEFGNDVTVRYFGSGPATVQPVASMARPVTRTLPVSEKAATPKLAQ